MSDPNDFASFMAGAGAALPPSLTVGQVVSGRVTQIGGDSVFVDLGTRAEGRVPRAQLELKDGSLPVVVGDTVQATVVDPGGESGPLLAVKLGKERVDLGALQMALGSETPVVGTVMRAVKGGLELDLNGVRAFCPASQVDRAYVADLTGFVGQELSVLVTEVREDDRSVIVSRRRALAAEQAQRADAARARLAVGQTLNGTVARIERYGAFVDVGGVEGLVHISELSAGRVESVEDAVKLGEEVQVQVLSIEDQPGKGPRIRLSMKALDQTAAAPPPRKDEVLSGRVVRLLPHGVVVATERGEGFVPKRELGLPPGADHRKAVAVDQALEVTLLDGVPGRLRFSAAKVEDVLAQQDFRDYRERAQVDVGGGLGSMAALLSGIDAKALPKGAPPPPAPPRPAPARPAPASAPSAAAATPTAATPAATASVTAASGTSAPAASTAPSAARPDAPDAPTVESPSDTSRRRRIVRSRKG